MEPRGGVPACSDAGPFAEEPVIRPTATPLAEHLACPDCGLEQVLPKLRCHQAAECRRCAHVLAGPSTGCVEMPLAFSIAALALLLPAMALPLLSISMFGTQRMSWFTSSVSALWEQGFASLAALVAALVLTSPLVYLILLIGTLSRLHSGHTV